MYVCVCVFTQVSDLESALQLSEARERHTKDLVAEERRKHTELLAHQVKSHCYTELHGTPSVELMSCKHTELLAHRATRTPGVCCAQRLPCMCCLHVRKQTRIANTQSYSHTRYTAYIHVTCMYPWYACECSMP